MNRSLDVDIITISVLKSLFTVIEQNIEQEEHTTNSSADLRIRKTQVGTEHELILKNEIYLRCTYG